MHPRPQALLFLDIKSLTLTLALRLLAHEPPVLLLPQLLLLVVDEVGELT